MRKYLSYRANLAYFDFLGGWQKNTSLCFKSRRRHNLSQCCWWLCVLIQINMEIISQNCIEKSTMAYVLYIDRITSLAACCSVLFLQTGLFYTVIGAWILKNFSPLDFNASQGGWESCEKEGQLNGQSTKFKIFSGHVY